MLRINFVTLAQCCTGHQVGNHETKILVILLSMIHEEVWYTFISLADRIGASGPHLIHVHGYIQLIGRMMSLGRFAEYQVCARDFDVFLVRFVITGAVLDPQAVWFRRVDVLLRVPASG